MSIVNMFNNTSEINRLNEKGFGIADFDIGIANLTYNTEDRFDIHSSKKVIYRTDTSEELGVHGDRYRPVAPKRMIQATRKILERSDLNLAGISESIQMSHNGGRTYVQYKLPQHTYNTPDGDTATLMLLATTSFDGTWPFLISVGALQAACLNTQVFTSGNVAVYKSKHTEGLDIDHGSNVIVKCLDVFENQRDVWADWYNTSFSESEALRFFAESVNWKPALEYLNANPYASANEVLGSVRQNKNFNYIWSRYTEHYTKKFGNNQWAAYNALTDWSSHAPLSKRTNVSNAAAVTAKRQEVVRTAISSWSKAA
jgi:hypothetical protein